MAKFRYFSQFSFLTLLFSLALSREASAYYSGHHYQHQPRHLASHRHQMTHRSSQSHFLPPSSSSGRVMPPLPPPPPPPSPKYPNLDRLLHRLDAEAAGKSEALTATSSPSLSPSTSSRRDLLPSFLRPTVPPPLPATPMPSFASPVASPPATSSHRHRHQQQQEDFYDDDVDEEDEEDDEEDRDRPGLPPSNGHRDSKVAWDLKFNEEANYQRQQPAGGGVGGGSLSLGGVGTSFSERKWHVLGNRQSLDEFRRRKMPRPSSTESEIREAVQHALKVSREGACKVPRPKVVQVKDVYPHPSKTYIPHCTILHQCGDDTGCCRHETYSCVPKTTHRVELHFYTTTLGRHQGNTVEKLVFYNHTECECLDKMEEMMPRDTGKVTEVGVRHFRHSSNNGRSDAFAPSAFRSYRPDKIVVEQSSEQSCRCPSLYSVRYPPNDHGSCSCDCFDKQRECIRAKRGKEYFSLQDRLCIQSEDCLQPSCEFGIYLRRAGRCPRKREKFAAWQRYTLDEYK